MLKRSPFAVATAAAPVGTMPDFAKELYVANAGHSEDGDFVTIASTTNRDLKLYLTTKQAVDGYSIPNIQWSDRVGETKVTIVKGGQSATLSFNEAVLSQAIQNPVPQINRPVPGSPGIGNNPNNTNLPMPIPHPMAVPHHSDTAATHPADHPAGRGQRESVQPPAQSSGPVERRAEAVSGAASLLAPQSSSAVSGFRSGPAEKRS